MQILWYLLLIKLFIYFFILILVLSWQLRFSENIQTILKLYD